MVTVGSITDRPLTFNNQSRAVVTPGRNIVRAYSEGQGNLWVDGTVSSANGWHKWYQFKSTHWIIMPAVCPLVIDYICNMCWDLHVNRETGGREWGQCDLHSKHNILVKQTNAALGNRSMIWLFSLIRKPATTLKKKKKYWHFYFMFHQQWHQWHKSETLRWKLNGKWSSPSTLTHCQL